MYSMEWSPGMECWSGVLECSGAKFWSEKVSCFSIHSDKAKPYFRKYQEHKPLFCRCGYEFLSDLTKLYFLGNLNDTKLQLGTGGYH